jgi:nitrite reductase (NADH) large subunit
MRRTSRHLLRAGEPAYEQARVLADHLAGRDALYSGSVVSTNLKVSGVSVFSAGDFLGESGADTLVFNDERRGTYKKLVVADGRLKERSWSAIRRMRSGTSN